MTRNPVGDNEAFSGTYWSSISNAHNQEATVSGCTPSKGSGDFDVDIASGEIINQGSIVSVSSDTITLNTSDSDDRVDIITADSSGNLSKTTGTAATDPVAPDIPSGEVLIATILVEGGASSLNSAGSKIADYRTIYEKSPTFESPTTRNDGASVTHETHTNRNASAGDESQFDYNFEDDSSNEDTFVRVRVSAPTITDTSEDGRYRIDAINGGTLRTYVDVRGDNDEVILQTGGAARVKAVSGGLDFPNSDNIQDAGTDAISFNGSQDVAIPNGGLLVGGTGSPTGNQELTDTGAATLRMTGDSDESITASGSTLAAWEGAWNDTVVGKWEVQTGDDDTNADDGDLVGFVSQGGTLSEVVRCHQEGDVEFGQNGNVGIGTIPSNIFEVDAGTAFWRASQGGSNEAQWKLKRDENPGDGALIAILDMVAQDSGGNDTVYGRIRTDTVDVTDGTEDGRVEFQTVDAGNVFTAPFAIESGHAEVATPTSTTGTSLIVSSDSSSLQEIARSSSTRRHKTDIQYLSPEDVNPGDVLAIDPAHFWMDEDHGDCPDAGFIAEDWHGLHPDLDDGLDYDDQDRVSGFRVDSRVIDAAQQLVLQDHDSRIEDLEDRVRELEAAA